MAVDQLIEAVHRGNVVTVARRLAGSEATEDGLAERIVACGDRIATQGVAARAEVVATLTGAGVSVRVPDGPTAAQRHTLTLRVDDVATAHRAAEALAAAGFEPWDRWTAGARVSFDRTADHLTVGRTRDHTLVVRIAWADPGRHRLVDRLLRPTHGDWAMVTLPRRLWWAYPGVRLVRLAAERVGVRSRHIGTLGPFLATPDELVAPLLAYADTTAGEVVVDLGCGDGRLPVTAAGLGCTARGVEVVPELADRARARVRDAGVDDLVTITTGDAQTADVGDADVVFAFLPTDVLAELLPAILDQLRPGARVVAHEQNRLAPGTPPPSASTVVVAEAALTVAHRWDA